MVGIQRITLQYWTPLSLGLPLPAPGNFLATYLAILPDAVDMRDSKYRGMHLLE